MNIDTLSHLQSTRALLRGQAETLAACEQALALAVEENLMLREQLKQQQGAVAAEKARNAELETMILEHKNGTDA